MKHQYFGDVNDFRKYGLLRFLQRESALKLAVCWMLTPDDGRTDGQFISYLAKPAQWRRYDPQLFDLLAEAVPKGRTLRHMDDRRVLPGSILLDATVPDDRASRASYFQDVLGDLNDSALVFFDPDNGIEVRSCPPGKRDSSKYVTWSELIATYNSGRSVLVYQHFPRQNRAAFISEVSRQLTTRTGAQAVTCFHTAHVAFFLIAQPHHEERLKRAADNVARIWREQIAVSYYANDAANMRSESLP